MILRGWFDESSVEDKIYVQLLSEFGVWWRGQEIPLPPSKKTRALFAYLVVAAAPVSRRKLCDVFYPHTNDPRGNLRWSMSLLRAAFKEIESDLIVTTRAKVSVSQQHIETDIQRLDSMTNEEILSGSASLSFGKFLPDFESLDTDEYLSWHASTDAFFTLRQIERLEELTAADCDSRALLECAEQWIVLAPEDERAWAQLVSAIAETGQIESAKQLRALVEKRMRRFDMHKSGYLVSAVQGGWNDGRSAGLRKAAVHLLTKTTLQVAKPRIVGESETDRDLLWETLHSAAGRCTAYACLSPSASLANADLELASTLSTTSTGTRLTAQLISSGGSEELFHWQIDYEDNALSLVDQVHADLSRRFEIDIPIALCSLAAKKPTTDLSAYDHYFLALPLIYGAVGYRSQEAFDRLELALGLAPDLSPALCAMAWVRSAHPRYNQTKKELKESEDMIRRAVEAAHDDAFVLAWSAISITHLAKDLDTAEDWARRATERNPYSSMANLAVAYVAHYRCQYTDSLAFLERYDGLGDSEPLTYLFYTVRALSHYQLEQTHEAVDWAKRAVGRNPNFVIAMRTLAAALVQAERIDEACEVVQQIQSVDASEYLEFFRARLPYPSSEPIDQLCRDLALAGMREARG